MKYSESENEDELDDEYVIQDVKPQRIPFEMRDNFNSIVYLKNDNTSDNEELDYRPHENNESYEDEDGEYEEDLEEGIP